MKILNLLFVVSITTVANLFSFTLYNATPYALKITRIVECLWVFDGTTSAVCPANRNIVDDKEISGVGIYCRDRIGAPIQVPSGGQMSIYLVHSPRSCTVVALLEGELSIPARGSQPARTVKITHKVTPVTKGPDQDGGASRYWRDHHTLYLMWDPLAQTHLIRAFKQ